MWEEGIGTKAGEGGGGGFPFRTGRPGEGGGEGGHAPGQLSLATGTGHHGWEMVAAAWRGGKPQQPGGGVRVLECQWNG